MSPNPKAAHNWTTLRDLRERLQRLWECGDLLASLVDGPSLFPKRFALRGPTPTDMLERFPEVRSWIQELQSVPHYRLQMRKVKHRSLGSNLIPYAIWVDRTEDALTILEKQRDAARFSALIGRTRSEQPRLVPWLTQAPFRALKESEHWSKLLEVVAWLKQHPRPGIYLRQVDIPGIDSKFVEVHQGVLAELLDVVLPREVVDQSASRTTEFERRYGFRTKPVRVRFRFLDCVHGDWFADPQSDLTLDGESFANLCPKVEHVFITENEINFLSFPDTPDSLIVFGSGYGFRTLSRAEWLSRCQLYYWGDIDTHGFAILDQLRSEVGPVQSLLMDRATLMEFQPYWGTEEKQIIRDLVNLNAEEQRLYDDLRDNRIRKNLRLEQERVGFEWVKSRLERLRLQTGTCGSYQP